MRSAPRGPALGLIAPDQPDYDTVTWATLPYPERLRLACLSWADQGFGAPFAVYGFYVVKVVLYVAGWAAFVTVGLDGVVLLGGTSPWWATPVAFQKAIVWTLVWESLGLGCASGPLTGRYWPPFGGVLHFARPGTTRLRPFTWVPGTAGIRRTWLDVALYAAFLAAAFTALAAPAVAPRHVLAYLLPLGLLGLRDKTVFLATRWEHYVTTSLVLLVPGDLFAGAAWVQLAIWFWAATSKLNRHFPAVIAVMVSNHPLLRSRRLRRSMYRDVPTDLRPSRAAAWLAHGGTVTEYVFPVLLVAGRGGTLTWIGLAIMLAFHGFITSSAPMGVPIEWNVLVVYGAFVLFGVHGDGGLGLESTALGVALVVLLVALPLYGNLVPSRISFLPAMRYYAGNWATSTWLLLPSAMAKLDEHLVTSARDVTAQLGRFYDEDTVLGIAGKALAFRPMHLHGRAYHDLLPAAAGSATALETFEIRDGELVAGMTLGWNFGDGHLHHEQLLSALHEQCGFERGEVRVVALESEPFAGGIRGTGTMHWRILDPVSGLLDEGHIATRDLLERQPWPTPAS